MTRVDWLRSFGMILTASGCALEPGSGFARLEPGTLSAAIEIGAARELTENSLLTDEGYRVELASCRLGLVDFELQALDSGGGGGDSTFDPANPPDGYSLCHGGHCHADDGSLVPYDEIQARLAGGSASWKPVARVALDAEVDLLEPTRRTLTGWEPSADLPEVAIARAVLRLDELHCEGRVEGDASREPLALEVSLPLAAAALRVPLDQRVSRDGPETLVPAVRLQIDGTLFDGLDFGSISAGPRVVLDRDDAVALESFASAAALTVQLHTTED